MRDKELKKILKKPIFREWIMDSLIGALFESQNIERLKDAFLMAITDDLIYEVFRPATEDDGDYSNVTLAQLAELLDKKIKEKDLEHRLSKMGAISDIIGRKKHYRIVLTEKTKKKLDVPDQE